MKLPKVTLIIPCRNEEKFLNLCVDSILENDYPKNLLEIFIVDGQSDDNTYKIAKKYQDEYPFIKVIENKKRIFPSSINLAYSQSHGDVIIILGAHASYSKNYISGNVEALDKFSVDNVGGLVDPIWPVKNLVGKAITIVLPSKFGNGGASYRTGTDKPILVTTVFGGCYRRSVFEKIGLFNEDLISSSDIDFNVRLKRNGCKTLLIPDVKVLYYCAETNFKKFIQNNLRNGFWTIYPLKFVDYIPVTLRHLIPLFFVLGIFGTLLLSCFSIYFIWLLLFVLGLYLIVSITFSLQNIKEGIGLFLILPLVYFSLHFSYGLGSLYGLFKVLLSKQFYIMHFSKNDPDYGRPI